MTARGAASVAAAVAAAVLLASAPARAERPRVVVVDFSGPGAGKVQRQVTAALARSVQLVARVDAREALAPGAITDDAARALIDALGADGLLAGAVDRARRRYRVALTLRDRDGAVAAELVVPLGRSPRLGRAARRRLRRQLLPAIASIAPDAVLLPPDDDDGDDSDDADGDAASGPLPRTIEIPSLPPQPRAEPAPVLLRGEPPARRGLSLAVGGGVLGRQLSFGTRDGVDRQPYEYRGLPVPAGRVGGALYPGALAGRRGFLGNLGLVFDFEQAVGVTSNIDGLDPDIPTAHRRWRAGAAYRFEPGARRTGLAVTVGASYGELSFAFDRAALAGTGLALEVPDVRYRAIEPHVAVRVPLGGRVAATARGGYQLIRDAGDIEGAAFFGAASGAMAVDVDAGLTVWLTSRLTLQLGAAYTHVDLAFADQGDQSDRDGDGAPDVTGALDQYLGGYLMAGVRL